MDAKQPWMKREPLARGAEKLAEDVSDVSRRASEELLEKIRQFRESIRHHPPNVHD